MTINVAAPNGATVDFPDGTDHDTIDRVMTQNFHPGASVRAAAAPAARMPTFEIAGPDGTYHLNAPDEQAAVAAWQAFQNRNSKTPDAMPAPATAPPDKYQQAAIDEQAALNAKGIDEGAGFTRRLAHGATLGADSTILAGLETPLEMMRHGTFSPSEGYDYAKAREDQIMGDARKNTGALGTAAEMLGGAVTGGNVMGGVGGLARDAAGVATMGGRAGNVVTARGRALSFGSTLAPDAGLAARTLASAADAGGIGGVSGFNEGNGLQERLTNAAKGFGTGFLAGGALPIAGATFGGITAPIFANIKARVNPEGFANSQIARAVSESGQTPQQLGQAVADGNAAGQPFTLADAMGNPGQRMLSTVTRAPGEGRTAAVDFLEGRQAGQGRRIGNALSEGFDSPQTAAQTEARLTAARDTQANADYGSVRDNANPVDVSNVVDHIDQQVAPFGVSHDRVAPDGITGRMLAYRRMLSGGNTELDGSAAGGLNDFAAAQRVRQELSDEIQSARQSGAGNKARILGGVMRQLDTSLENASTGFRQANANFARGSRDIDAVDTGRTAATRGRTEDTIPAFQALPASGQAAFRAGYVDPLIASTQGAAHGVNKARPFTSDAFREEAAAMAPRGQVVNGRVIPGANVNVAGPRMQQRLNREQTMFETRNQAMGNSKTSENLNDDAAMGVPPSLVHNVIVGNWHGAIGNVLSAGHTAMTGNTPAVRAAVGRILLDRGVTPANLQAAIGQTVARIQFVQNLSRGMGRAGAGALAVARPGQTVGGQP